MTDQQLPKILLVDDTPANLAVMRRLLASLDCEIVEAPGGNEALARFIENEFALILLDVHMPVMDGYEVARLIREDRDAPRTPIIFVTAAYDDDVHRDRGYETGAVDYLAKPIEPAILLAKVRIFLELYEAKRALQDLTENLESVVQVRTRELQEALQTADSLRTAAEEALARAEEAGKVRTRFLSRISHELRTPMNGILGLLELLERSALDDQQRDYLNGIESSANSLLVTLNEVLDFSQLTKDAVKTNPVPFRLSVLLGELADSISVLAREKSLSLFTDYGLDVEQELLGDASLIRRVILVFGHNAVKFSNDGELRLRAEGTASENGLLLRIGVQDAGAGITRVQQKLIFEGFAQADESSTRTTGGVGLGLAVAKVLASAMGGTLTVESELGRGSCFWLELQLPYADSSPKRSAGDAKSTRGTDSSGTERKLRVLVAEDNKVNQMVACGMLNKIGAESVVANDGVEAVELFQAGQFDLVLMDLDMPRKDGFDATREIRACEAASGGKPGRTQIVALTANLEGETRQRCLDAGMDEYLGKPVHLNQLRDMINRLDLGMAEASPD